jgi:hypothetical protein
MGRELTLRVLPQRRCPVDQRVGSLCRGQRSEALQFEAFSRQNAGLLPVSRPDTPNGRFGKGAAGEDRSRLMALGACNRPLCVAPNYVKFGEIGDLASARLLR